MDLTGQVGDSLAVAVRVLDVAADGVATPRQLGGATLATRVRWGKARLSDAAPDNLRATVTDAAKGLVAVSLPADHTLPPGQYRYEVDLRQRADSETLLAGALTIADTLLP